MYAVGYEFQHFPLPFSINHIVTILIKIQTFCIPEEVADTFKFSYLQ